MSFSYYSICVFQLSSRILTAAFGLAWLWLWLMAMALTMARNAKRAYEAEQPAIADWACYSPEATRGARSLRLCGERAGCNTDHRLHVGVTEFAHKVFVRGKRVPWPHTRVHGLQIAVRQSRIMTLPAAHAGAAVGCLMMWLPCPVPPEARARGEAFVKVLA